MNYDNDTKKLPPIEGFLSGSGGNEYAPQKLTDWKYEPSLSKLLSDLKIASTHHEEQMRRIDKWLSLIHVKSDKSRIDAGRSGISPKVARRLAEWRYGSLSVPLLQEKNLFQVNATSPDYIQAAVQNERVLNYQFNNMIDKVTFINSLVRTAVNEGTAIIRVGWDAKYDVVEEEQPIFAHYIPDTIQAMRLNELVQNMGDSGNIDESFNEELKESILATQTFGQPTIAKFTGRTKKVLKRIKTRNSPSVKVVPNNRVIIDPSCEGDIDKARFVVYKYYSNYYELEATGRYQNLKYAFRANRGGYKEDFSSGGNVEFYPFNLYSLSDEEFSRLTGNDSLYMNFQEEAKKIVPVYEYWGYWDIHGTGIPRPFVATILGNTIIRLEENPFPDGKFPFVSIPYLPVKGSIYGEADAELVEDSQHIIRALTRAVIDIQARSANGQIGIPKGFLDPINRKKFNNGQDYEYSPNGMMPAEAIYMHTTPEASQTALTLLQQHMAESEAATGVKSFQGGIDGDAYGRSSLGASQATVALNQREADIMFRISKGLEQIGNKIIAMNSLWLSEEEHIAVTRNEFISVKKEDLAGDFYLSVSVKSNAEAETKAQQLAFIMQTLGDTVDWGVRKILLIEFCRLYNLDTTLDLINEYEPQPDPVQQKQVELEIAKLEAEIAKLKAEADYNMSKSNFVEAQVDDVQASTDQKYLDYLRTQDGTKHREDVEKITSQAYAQGEVKAEQERIKGANNFRNALAKASIDQKSGNLRFSGGTPKTGQIRVDTRRAK